MDKESSSLEDASVTNSGIEAEGSWSRICEFSEDVEKRIKDLSDSENSWKKFEEWRPRKEEEKNDVHRRTAEKASIDRTDIEKDFKGTKEELETAAEKVRKQTVLKGFSGFIRRIWRVAATKTLEGLRFLEREIYDRLMLKFNPYYLDTEEISVNLREKEEERYIMKVNVLDSGVRDGIQGPARDGS